MNTPNTFAVIFAGGTGSRMQGAKIPKQFLKLGGKSILAHTLCHFEKHPQIVGIVVVCIEEGLDELQRIVREEHFEKILAMVPGGQTGQDSIYNGLEALADLEITNDDSIVLIHDGVRPLIDEKTITDCIESVSERGATATVAPAIETIIEEVDGQVVDIIDRSKCKLARAPQGFLFDLIWGAHLRARAEGFHDFIDSISMMNHYGWPIYTIEGPADNIKITTKRDFFAFKGYMDNKELGQLWE